MGRTANSEISSISTPLRTEILGAVSANGIQNLDKDALLKLQSRMGLGSVWGIIEIPTSWVPPGVCSARSSRILDMRLANQSDSIDLEQGELGILTLTRYTLLCFLVPVTGSRVGAVLLAPTTISSSFKYLRPLVKLALQKPSGDGVGVLSRLGFADLQSIVLGNKSQTELNRLLQFKYRGYWSDVPTLDATEVLRLGSKPQTGEAGNVKVAAEVGNRGPEPFLPFSDEFVGEVGWRVAWIVEHLGPQLISCAESLAAIYGTLKSTSEKLHALETKRSKAASTCLNSYAWTDRNGHVLIELPFEIRFTGQGKGPGFCWPPKTHAELKGLLILLQTAHLHIVLLSTGGRISEVLSFQVGCIVEAVDGSGTAAGRTYKLVTTRGGEKRDLPLPAIGVLSVYQQERLARVSDAINLNGGVDEPENEEAPLDGEPADKKTASADALELELELGESISNPIWRRVGTGKRITSDYNDMLMSAIAVLGLTGLADGINPHAHRYRKTVARLLALALSDAPKILMDLFGHKSIEMTLHYMLSDPLIRAEMQEVLKAQTIMLAVDAIENIDDYGGPAAARFKEAIESTKARLGSEYGAKDTKDLAEIFTLSGTVWALVRPGIICTKLPQQAGPCNKQVGMPESSKCRSHCESRLEKAALRDDVNRSIEQAFQFFEEAKLEDNETMAAMWLGQVHANLDRFPVLKQKWEGKLSELQSQLVNVSAA